MGTARISRLALVTGGAGFIGSHLTARLVRDGWRVRVLDDESTGSWANLEHLRGQVDCVTGDTRDRAVCEAACEGADSVFHLAAIASVAASIAHPRESHEVNLTGTVNVLAACRDQGVRRFVLASSAAVYGDAERVPTDEAQPLRPQSPYATAKATGELYCRNFTELYGLETVALRFFNAFGPGQPHAGYAAVIPSFIQALGEGCRPVVYGDGRQTRDFVYVANVVDALVRAVAAEGVSGAVFNIAAGRGVSVLDLLEEMSTITGRRLNAEFRPARCGEVRHSRADISRAREALGYSPRVGLADGLRRTLTAHRAARVALGRPVAV